MRTNNFPSLEVAKIPLPNSTDDRWLSFAKKHAQFKQFIEMLNSPYFVYSILYTMDKGNPAFIFAQCIHLQTFSYHNIVMWMKAWQMNEWIKRSVFFFYSSDKTIFAIYFQIWNQAHNSVDILFFSIIFFSLYISSS